MRWLPPLTALRAFEAVGRRGMATAAADLNVTPAAIYHQIRALESELGVALFTRSKGRGLVLTLKGEIYLTQVAQIFDQIHESARKIREETWRRRLVVDSLTSFATDFLIPRLPRFIEANPDIELEILTATKSFGRIRLESTGADLAIRGGSVAGHWEGMHAEQLVHETMFPVCAPGLLRGPKAIRRPADLAKHTLLTVARAPEGWSDWLDAAAANGEDVSGIKLDRAIKFDLFHLSMTAAVQGIGVDMARAPLADRYLESGAVVAPFDLRVTSQMSYWLVCAPAFAETPVYKQFRDWLLDEISESKYIQEPVRQRAVQPAP
jgi:LysR family glycine cleavage system transcriptional activator